MAVDLSINKEEQSTTLLDVAQRALDSFQYIEENEYIGSASGKSSNTSESFPCDCPTGPDACDAKSDCINRTLFIECMDCIDCHNQRFHRKQNCNVSIIDTNKGFGVASVGDIKPGEFVLEYVGQVIPHSMYIKRSLSYKNEERKHIYFMTLNSEEVIDATIKGGIARFINHSCDPNCELQKWTVGKRIRIGIFAKRLIMEGEELTFDYKFERFGETAQICLCGSKNCTGIIGRKRKNDNKRQDEWDEEEEEEMAEEKNVLALTCNLDVDRLVKSFLKASKPSTLHKLLDRLFATEISSCLRRFVHLHGLLLLKNILRETSTRCDPSICRKVLLCLSKLPICDKNIIINSNIETVLKPFLQETDIILKNTASMLLNNWGKLECIYRIPKRNVSERDENSDKLSNELEEKIIKNGGYIEDRKNASSLYKRRSYKPTSPSMVTLPNGWFMVYSNGSPYYYTSSGLCQREFPTTDAPKIKSKNISMDSSERKDFGAIEGFEEVDVQHVIEKARKRAKELEEIEKEKEKLEIERIERRKEKRKFEQEKKRANKEKTTRTTDSSGSPLEKSLKEEVTPDSGFYESKRGGENNNQSKLKEDLSSLIVSYLSRYKSQMSQKEFKKHEKEERKSESSSPEEMKKKVKKFIEIYVEKLKNGQDNK